MTEEFASGMAKDEVESEMVQISKGDLDELKREIAGMKASQSMLVDIADKVRLGAFLARHPEQKLSTCTLGTYNGKTIIGWRMITDEVFQDGQNRWTEKQLIELEFDGGDKEVVQYVSFVRNSGRVAGEITKRSFNEDGSTTVAVRVEGGRVFEIDIKFINP